MFIRIRNSCKFQLLIALMVRDRCNSCWNSCSLMHSTEHPCGLTFLLADVLSVTALQVSLRDGHCYVTTCTACQNKDTSRFFKIWSWFLISCSSVPLNLISFASARSEVNAKSCRTA